MIRLALRVRREDAELALAELLALAPSGVEELEVDDELVEFAVYGSPGELPELPDLRAAAGAALVEVSTSELPDDWSERWKRFHRPIVIDAPAAAGVPSLRVRPPWEPAACIAGTEEIVIDPDRHLAPVLTTPRACVLSCCLHLPRRNPLAAHCSTSAVAPECWPLPLPKSVLRRCSVSTMSPRACRRRARTHAPMASRSSHGALICAARHCREAKARASRSCWLTSSALLLDLAVSLAGESPRCMVLSGLLREEADEVVAVFHERLGLHERERRHGGEWAAVWLSSTSNTPSSQ